MEAYIDNSQSVNINLQENMDILSIQRVSALLIWPQCPNLELAEGNLPSLRLLRFFSSKGQEDPQL